VTTTLIDEVGGLVTVTDKNGERTFPLASAEGFAAVSRAWLRAGWDAKHVYSFTWMGRPMIQLPEDMLRLQEVIYRVKPTLIIETGVAHGGSLIFHAGLFKAMGVSGRVVGVDIEIRPHNRAAVEAHELYPYITLIEGGSTAPETVAAVRALVRPDDKVMVILDSNHSKAHVSAELELYGALVSPGSYIVACDGIMEQVAGAPRTETDWDWNNPSVAAREFAAARPDFVLEEPPFAFNEGLVAERVTYWPDAFLRKIG
jgi:cephalosporin hydroxylase